MSKAEKTIRRDKLHEVFARAVRGSGMSLREVAELAGIIVRHVQRLMNGTTSPGAIPEILRRMGWRVTEYVSYREPRG